MSWQVQVIESDTGQVIKTLHANGDRSAERIERGIQINLNHEKYHTEVINKAAQAQKEK